ncbi:hypothetical protein [Parasitella parasitica]|uniref:GATA-type domain-containing protein n=1 Tax=Parasitella parasitica TaxID=35722 RepID=A0A0B7N8A4_9FUNG|nr:hypothetical protein [Parasitella parasitica]
MDISKICIDTTPETIDSVSSLSTISTPSENRDPLPPINVNNNDRHPYQLQYQLQHQYLKSYGPKVPSYQQQETPSLPYPPSDHPDQRNTSPYHTKSVPALLNVPRPIAPQPTSSTSSYQQYQSASTSSSIPPPPPSNYPPPIQPAPPFLHEHNSNNTATYDDTDNLMKHIIDQCTSIYQKIGKYRTDPLRESERNQIIDHVFFTAEDMLNSLNILNNRMDDSELDAPIDPAATNTVSTQQIDLSNQDDLVPPSGNESTLEEYKMIRQARNLQKNARPKYRRRSKTSMVGHRCHSCNTTDTPEWRRGPDGARTLCNACGLRSLTVQTHNYMLEAPPDGPRPQTRAIQFPIIQVSNTDTNTTTITKSSFSKYSTSARIAEVNEEEENAIELKQAGIN